MSTAHPSVGATPNSVVLPRASRIEHAENLTPHPHGSSELYGIPLPPPVIEPMTVTLGSSFIMETKLFAAENVLLLASITTGLRHMRCPYHIRSLLTISHETYLPLDSLDYPVRVHIMP